MNLALSIFDVFTYAIPGSIYLAVLIYISNRLDWIRLEAANSLNTTILFFGAVLASYLLGHITYQLGRGVERMLPIWKQGLPDPKQVFLSDVPKSKGEFLARLNPHLLLAAVEVRTKEAAVEINRLRAIGLMLRNCVPALLLASVVSIAEVLVGEKRLFATCSSALFLMAALMAMRHGRTMSRWAIAKTLQVSYWTIDATEMWDRHDHG